MKSFMILLLAIILIGCSDMGNPVEPEQKPRPHLVLDDLHGDSWMSGVVVCTAPDIGVPFDAYVQIRDDTLRGDIIRYRGGWRFGRVLPRNVNYMKVIGIWQGVCADTLILTNWE